MIRKQGFYDSTLKSFAQEARTANEEVAVKFMSLYYIEKNLYKPEHPVVCKHVDTVVKILRALFVE